MGFFNFFKKEDKTQEINVDQFKESIDRVLIDGYRNIGQPDSLSPISNLHDEQILKINNEIMGIYKEASSERSETIKAESLFAIVFHFLVVYATRGDKFYYEHIDYEIEKYLKEGPRGYQNEGLSLFWGEINLDVSSYNKILKD